MEPRCSFCSKAPSQVFKLVAGPGVWICNECVELCAQIIEDERRESPASSGNQLPTATRPERSR